MTKMIDFTVADRWQTLGASVGLELHADSAFAGYSAVRLVGTAAQVESFRVALCAKRDSAKGAAKTSATRAIQRVDCALTVW